jgi:hypothetical protein
VSLWSGGLTSQFSSGKQKEVPRIQPAGAKEISLGDICCIQEHHFGIQKQGNIQKPEKRQSPRVSFDIPGRKPATQWVNRMNSIAYALMAYGLTALISLAVVGLIVVINRLMGKSDSGNEQEAD